MNNIAAIRTLIIYAVCIPLALILGYLITDPLDRTTDTIFGVVLLLLLVPLLFRWYHAWLLAVWNMAAVITFLPGLFPIWIPVGGLAFLIAMGHYALNRDRKFIQAGSVGSSLVFLSVVTLVTAKFRGGLGFHAFGDEAVGGKRYLWIWMAVIGYFALTSQAIPRQKRNFYAMLFLLGGMTSALSTIADMSRGALGFLYLFFPSASSQYSNVIGNPFAQESLERFGGFALAGGTLAYVLIARYGMEGILNVRKLWRPVLFFLALVSTLFGGYRSIIILTGLTIVMVFCFEGVWRTRLMPIIALGVILAGGLVVSFSNQLPLSCQRCLAFLPLKIDPVARLSAEGSSDWRLEMWRSLYPQIPQYLFLGKGLTFDANDMAMNMTLGNQVEGDVGGQAALAGDYHNGPLSLIIPFGIWGAIGFLWFLAASLKVLWANYKYGDPEVRTINVWVISYFVARTIFFFAVFGGFYSDLMIFTGLIGFSVSLNGGVAKPALAPQPARAFNRFRPLPLGKPLTTS